MSENRTRRPDDRTLDKVCMLLLCGYNFQEIAEALDRHQWTVHNWLVPARKYYKAKNTIHLLALWLASKSDNEIRLYVDLAHDASKSSRALDMVREIR